VREPGRCAPLMLFMLLVVLALDYRWLRFLLI
jgi:hypothetical protein